MSMNPCPFSIDTARELRLRRHIREVLLPYARTHITSDHVALTETLVEEILLRTLEYVPMADTTSFLLPTEPLEVLMRSLDSLDLTPPEEKWVAQLEHVRYLKSFFPPPPRPADLRSEKSWDEGDHYEKLSLVCRPILSPVLSQRARRETPKLGSTNSRSHIPRTKSALTAFLHLDPVSIQDTEDMPASPMDEVLDLRLTLDSATVAAIRPFLSSVVVSPSGKKSTYCFGDTPNVYKFLSRDSPPRSLPGLASPPLFSRSLRGRSADGSARSNAESGICIPGRVSDLGSVLQVASQKSIPSEDGDINGHHMEVVNEWTTFTFSSPPPPSLHSSDGSEVNELWKVSPPGTPATSLMTVKMDEVEIPRTRKFGHKNTSVHESTNSRGTADLLTMGNSPGFFITSFISAPIPQALKSITSQLEGAKSGVNSPHPTSPHQSTSNSLFLQPPGAPGEQAVEDALTGRANYSEVFEMQYFDDTIASIYASTPQDPFFYIREEKLEEKEIALMDVPNLPPPTAHPKEPILFPKGMQYFVSSKGESGHHDITDLGSKEFGPMAFLRPVKGMKPLALDLSWRPFNFGKTMPTDEGVAGIVRPIRPEDEALGNRDSKYEKTVRVLLDLDIPPISAEDNQITLISNIPRVCEEFGTSPVLKRGAESGSFEYVLTQRERMRASGSKITLEADVEVRDDVDERGNMTRPHNGENESILRLAWDRNLREDDEYQCSQNSTDHGYSFYDSGIDIMDNNLGQFSTSEFGVPSLLLQPFQDDIPHALDTLGTDAEDDDNQSENKENVPPQPVDDFQPAEYQSDLASQYDWSGYFEFPESETPTFEPLSFASQSQLLGTSDHFAKSKIQDAPQAPSSGRVERAEFDLAQASEREQTNARATKRRKLEDLVPPSSKDLFYTFIGLRNQITSSRTPEHSETQNNISEPYQTLNVSEQMLPRAPPDDLFDRHTVRLPEHWIPTAAVHRYLASLALIQKRALVHELQGHHCRVVLVERYDLGGIDVVIDPNYGVLFVPLLALPAHLESAIERISCESWRYLYLLVIFEAFPSAQSYRANHPQAAGSVPCAYTPPICKAIKKLRRNLGIAEGCGTMNPRCTVTWAFANGVEEAAKFVRCFGEEACANSTERDREMLWDERAWLEEEEREGESDLARVHGMNAFAAFIMLYNRPLEMILDLSPEDRLADFGRLLGEERVKGFNAIIASRMRQIAPDVPDSVVDL